MAEFETVVITNPTKADFTARWNGELYTVKAGASKSYPMFLAFHIAKHLTTSMLEKEAGKLREEFKESVTVPQVSTLMNHDNPSRRIALYDVLATRELVESFFIHNPFKSFVGDMSIYDKYVEKKEAKSAPASSGDSESIDSSNSPEKKEK